MSSGFVTETELEAKRVARQEEWERVRKPDEPKEAPEEAYDSRSLFERLDEQRQKKQIDWEEEHKLKNQIRGLNDDEVDFLDKVDDYKTEWEKKRMIEEKKELEEYQKKQMELREKEMEERLRNERKVPELRKVGNSTKNSQMKLLAGAVKRKADPAKSPENKKAKDDNVKNATSKNDTTEKGVVSPIKDSTTNGTVTGTLIDKCNGEVAATGAGDARIVERNLSTSSGGDARPVERNISTSSGGDARPVERNLSTSSGGDARPVERNISTSSGGLLGLGEYGSGSDEEESD